MRRYYRAVSQIDRRRGSAPTGVPGDAADPDHVLRLAMRVGVAMLTSGAQTDEVEAAIVATTAGLGLPGVQASVAYSTISISYYASRGTPPATLLHLVRERRTDFGLLAGLSELVDRIHDGELSVAQAEARLVKLQTQPPKYGRAVTFVAPALSAGGATLAFGGDAQEVVATIAIALAVQAVVVPIGHSSIQPFFRTLIVAASATLLVALVAGLAPAISGGLVLTGSLLRFLPGYALLAGFRDLLDQSVLSGMARVAEAVLIAAAIGGGVGIALIVAAGFGVELSLITIGQQSFGWLVSIGAVAVLVGGFAVGNGVPPLAVAQSAAIGAVGWVLYRAGAAPYGPLDPSIVVVISSVTIGILGRLAVGRSAAPTALWVVPAILPLLPGLPLVQAMLAASDEARLAGLVGAATTAFLIGTGVATGDLAVVGFRRFRDGLVAPAVGAVAEGVDTLVIQPAARVARPVSRAVLGTQRHGGTASGDDAGDPGASPTSGPD